MRGDVVREHGEVVGVSVWSGKDTLLDPIPEPMRPSEMDERWALACELEPQRARPVALVGADGRPRKRRCLECGERSTVRLVMGLCERCREARR